MANSTPPEMTQQAAAKNPRARKAKTNSSAAPPSIRTLNEVQAAACDQYGRPEKTRTNYKGYLARGFKFLQELVDARRVDDIDDDDIDTDLLEKAFACPPNKYSLMALESFITQKCFHEGNGEATANGIQSAFADYWDHMGGHSVWAGEYLYDEKNDSFTGCPARATSIKDMIKAVKTRSKVEGVDRSHAQAMRLPELKQAMNCSERHFPSEAAKHLPKNDEERKIAMDELELRAMSSFGFYVWTRNFELTGIRARHITRDCIGPAPHYHPHIKVLVENRKGWQGRTGHDGPLESKDFPAACTNDLIRMRVAAKQYNVYPEPGVPEMDLHDHLLRWLDYLERDIGRPLGPDEFIFPYISSNGTVQLNREMRLTKVQSLINKFTKRAGLPKYYTTHCFRRGGAQYRFMDAPMVERWSLRAVRWWGAWKDNESLLMLIKYLFDSLQSYETSYGDQLCPSGPRESFMGNHKNVQPATVQDLQNFSSTVIGAVHAAIHAERSAMSSSTPPVTANPTVCDPTLARSLTIGSTSINSSTMHMIPNSWAPFLTLNHTNPSTATSETSGASSAPTIGSCYPYSQPSVIDASTFNASTASSGAAFFSPIVTTSMPRSALPSSYTYPLMTGYHIDGGSTPIPVHTPSNPLTTNHLLTFPSTSSPAVSPSISDYPSQMGSSNGAHAYNMSNSITHPIVSYPSPPLTSYAPSLGAPSPDVAVSTSRASMGTESVAPGPLLASNMRAINRCPTTSPLPPSGASLSLASIPDLDRGRGKGGWRQAIRQWENVDPQTGHALKDWPMDWYKGGQKNKVAVKRGYRKTIAVEYKRLGETEERFLEAHPEADTIGFLALVKKINTQNGSRGRASKNGPPDARSQRS